MIPKYNYEKALFYIALGCNTSKLDDVNYILSRFDSWKVNVISSKFGKVHDIEVISPILCYATLNDLNDVLASLQAFCKFNDKSYLHVYCYCDNFTFKDCISLCNLQVPKSDLIARSLQVELSNDKKLDNTFICEIQNLHSMEEFKKVWYDFHNEDSKSVIDFHEFFNGKGIALKYFNATFEFDVIKAYIDLSNAMVLASSEHFYKPWTMPTKGETSEKRFMLDFLWKLGIVGKERQFKATRAILSNHLVGKAWN